MDFLHQEAILGHVSLHLKTTGDRREKVLLIDKGISENKSQR